MPKRRDLPESVELDLGLDEADDEAALRAKVAAHLGLAILIFGLIVWTALDIGERRARSIRLDTITPSLRRIANVLVVLVFAQGGEQRQAG